MRAIRLSFLTVLLPLAGAVMAPGAALTTDLTSPAGLWQAVDDNTKEPTGWFLITGHDGVYDGIIAKMFFKPGENPNVVCDKCSDDRHNHPWLGLQIIRGMAQESADKFGGGTILDPRDGKTYHATMKLAPDGQTLIVRGYLGFEMLGQNQYWTRLPDSAFSMLDPSVNPNPAVGPGAPKAAPGQHKSELPQRPQSSAQR